MVAKNIMTDFGVLECADGPEGTSIWSAQVAVNNRFFEEHIPLYIFTKAEKPSVVILAQAETIIGNIEHYLEIGLSFLKKTLTEQANDFKITASESIYLDKNIAEFPVDLPEIILYDEDEQWILRFAEGLFSICDPYGIHVNFSSDHPIAVDNLEDSEEI
ncbi:MAG: hypothetical protein LBF27_03725 [Sphingobacterium sp.]|jgi:hypothetical protein|nr:hypothetical protein [Sphingobacterium sp.]